MLETKFCIYNVLEVNKFYKILNEKKSHEWS